MNLTTLGEVCKFQSGFSFKSSKYKQSGLPILGIKNFKNGKIDLNDLDYFDPKDYEKNLDKYIAKPGDLFIAMFGSTAGKIGCNNTKTTFFLNERVNKIEPNEEQINKRWLFHWLLNNEKISSTIIGSGAIPYLDINKLKKLIISLPSLTEQNSKNIR